MRSPVYRLIILLLVASFVVIFNETAMSVALPSLSRSLAVSPNTAQWLTTGFMLTLAILVPTTGYTLQRLHTRTIFVTAMSLFIAGTILATLATGFHALLIARVVQAVGTSAMIPLMITTLMAVAPESKRGMTMGVANIVIAAAPALGPAISGLILQYLPWHYLFLFMIPPAVTVLVLGILFLENLEGVRASGIDPLSILLTIPSFGLLLYGISKFGMPQESAARWIAWTAVASGMVFTAVFGVRQAQLQRRATPWLDLRVFMYRGFRNGLMITLFSAFTLFGLVVLIPLYLERSRGLGTLQTGVFMLPAGALMGVISPVAGRLHDTLGSRIPMMAGAGILTIMVATISFTARDFPIWLLAIQYAMAIGIGLGLLTTPATTSALSPLPPNFYSHGNAVLMTLQQLAGATGAAALIAIVAAHEARAQTREADAIRTTWDVAAYQPAFAAAAIAAAGAFVFSLLSAPTSRAEGRDAKPATTQNSDARRPD